MGCGDEKETYIEVGGVRRGWEEGKVLVFDDMKEHMAQNMGKQDRVVLLFDMPRALANITDTVS